MLSTATLCLLYKLYAVRLYSMFVLSSFFTSCSDPHFILCQYTLGPDYCLSLVIHITFALQMLTTLFVLVSHHLFDWSCRGSKADLAHNFGQVVKDNFGVDPDLSLSSPLYKGATKLYKLVRKKKYVNKSRENVIKCEEENLKAFEIELGNLPVKDDKETVRKRKNYEDLTSKTSKRARVKSVIDILESDVGLEQKVMEKLEVKKGGGKGDEDFDLSCLALMKTMGISNTKYDDLRFWVQDMLRRDMDLASMPTSRQLMEKVQKEMIPPNMSTTEIGASIPLVDALYHTVRRLLPRF